MIESNVLRDLSKKIKELIKNSPHVDVGKNMNALIQGAFTKMELVSREEFEVQSQLLENAQKKLARLEAKLAELEARNK